MPLMWGRVCRPFAIPITERQPVMSHSRRISDHRRREPVTDRLLHADRNQLGSSVVRDSVIVAIVVMNAVCRSTL